LDRLGALLLPLGAPLLASLALIDILAGLGGLGALCCRSIRCSCRAARRASRSAWTSGSDDCAGAAAGIAVAINTPIRTLRMQTLL